VNASSSSRATFPAELTVAVPPFELDVAAPALGEETSPAGEAGSCADERGDKIEEEEEAETEVAVEVEETMVPDDDGRTRPNAKISESLLRALPLPLLCRPMTLPELTPPPPSCIRSQRELHSDAIEVDAPERKVWRTV
jgi:hypothetical protein